MLLGLLLMHNEILWRISEWQENDKDVLQNVQQKLPGRR
jgi:hypothetical protein